MEENPKPLPPYPERRPEPALFSLDALYSRQPFDVRFDHAERIALLGAQSKWIIQMCHYELRIRQNLTVPISPEFIYFHERYIELNDEEIQSRIDFHEDLLLTYVAHLALSRPYGVICVAEVRL